MTKSESWKENQTDNQTDKDRQKQSASQTETEQKKDWSERKGKVSSRFKGEGGDTSALKAGDETSWRVKGIAECRLTHFWPKMSALRLPHINGERERKKEREREIRLTETDRETDRKTDKEKETLR